MSFLSRGGGPGVGGSSYDAAHAASGLNISGDPAARSSLKLRQFWEHLKLRFTFVFHYITDFHNEVFSS